jgi:hypothetical protein
MVESEVTKREVLDRARFEEAAKRIKRYADKPLRDVGD